MRRHLTTIRLARFLPLLLVLRRSPCWDRVRLDLWRASQWGAAHRSSGELTTLQALAVLDGRPVRSVVLSRLARVGGASGAAATVLKRLSPESRRWRSAATSGRASGSRTATGRWCTRQRSAPGVRSTRA